MTLLDKFMIALGFQVDDTGLEKFERRAESVREQASLLADTVGGLLTAAFVELFKSFVDTSAQFEKFSVVLSVLYDSASQGKQAMNWISDFAVKTPYQLAEVTEAFLRLKAFGLDPTQGALRVVGDTAAAFGRPLMDAVFAMDDAIEGINRPLRTFGISVKEQGNMVTYSFIKNGQMISKSVDKTNKIAVAKTLESIWNERYGGAMDKLSTTWSGMINNLLDQITRFKQKVMNAGPFEDVKDQLKKLLDLVNEYSSNGFTEKFALGFDIAFEFMTRTIHGTWIVVDAVVRRTIGWKIALTALSAVFAGIFISSVARTINLIWRLVASVLAFDAATVVIFALGAALVLIIDDLWNYYHGNESIIGQLQKKFPFAVGIAYAAIMAIVGAFIALKWASITSLAETIGIVAMYAAEWAVAAATTLAGLASMVVGAAVTAVGWIASFGSMAIATIAATWPILAIIAAVALVGFAAYELWKHWDTVTKAMHKAWTWIVDEIKSGMKWILDKLTMLGDKAYNFIKMLPGGAKALEYTAKFSGLQATPTGSSPSSTLGNSVNATGGVIGRAGSSSVATSHSQSVVTHHETVNAPITVVSPDPDKAGQSVKRVLGQRSRQVVRNSQSAVAL